MSNIKFSEALFSIFGTILFSDIAFKIGVRIKFEGALDSSTNKNNIQLYRFLRNNV